ncbi:MAG: ABC transporter permease, partial [Rhodothermales bacterium]
AAFSTAIEPTLLRLAAEDAFSYLVARVQPGTALQTADDLQAAWKTVAPGTPYNGFFQDDVFDSYWQGRAKSQQIFSSIAFVALLLTCMGLFGLVSLNITRRMKELSIRKVLGASLRHIVHQISRELILVLVVATVVAVPASYLLLKALYDAAGGYHMSLGPTPFVITFGMILLTAMLTVATHVYKAATANPVVALRDE